MKDRDTFIGAICILGFFAALTILFGCAGVPVKACPEPVEKACPACPPGVSFCDDSNGCVPVTEFGTPAPTKIETPKRTLVVETANAIEEEPALRILAGDIVLFAYDSAELDDAARAAIKSNAHDLLLMKPHLIMISGHADAKGTDGYNLSLALARADAVASEYAKLGLKADSLRLIVFGNRQQICSTPDEACRAASRRVETEIFQQKEPSPHHGD